MCERCSDENLDVKEALTSNQHVNPYAEDVNIIFVRRAMDKPSHLGYMCLGSYLLFITTSHSCTMNGSIYLRRTPLNYKIPVMRMMEVVAAFIGNGRKVIVGGSGDGRW